MEKDTTVKITGLAEGDKVDFYQVLKWVDGAGWQLAPGFASLSTNASIAKLIDAANQDQVELSKADVEAITTAAKAAIATNKNTPITGFTTATATVGTGATSVEPTVALGMWLALVTPNDVDTVYNPIIVSADFTVGSNVVDSSDNMGTAPTVAKKETITLEKTTAEITLNTGDAVQFTVTTTIPAYADSYVNPKFNMHDQLSTGLKFVVDSTHPITVSSGDVTYTGAPATNDTNFTLTFDTAKIAALVAPQPVTVTYYAKLTSEAPWNINEETNDVTVEFSNNPGDDTDHSHLKDEVKEYTFDIDSTIFGGKDYITGEIVKVGVDRKKYS